MPQLGHKSIVGGTAESIKVQVSDISCSPFLTNLAVLSQKAVRLDKHELPFVNPFQLFQITIIISYSYS